MYYLLSHGWSISELWKDGRAWDSYVLQAKRGDWLLEVITCEGLTDEAVLVLPKADKLIRLDDTAELHKISAMAVSQIWELWTERSGDAEKGSTRSDGAR
jgi:hypothetical protein